MGISLTPRGQSLFEKLKKYGNPNPVSLKKPVWKEYTLYHVEMRPVEGKKKPVEFIWSKKIRVDEARI